MHIDAKRIHANTAHYSNFLGSKMTKKRAPSRASNPTVSVSLRIDPKTKYLVDLLAREQKRTITGVIEWAIERAAGQISFKDREYGLDTTFLVELESLWSTDESLRVVRLALAKPSLLDYDELRVWETIKATPAFWKVPVQEGASGLREDLLYVSLLQEHWEALIEHVGKHQNSRSIVPYTVSGESQKTDFSDFPDDLPY